MTKSLRDVTNTSLDKHNTYNICYVNMLRALFLLAALSFALLAFFVAVGEHKMRTSDIIPIMSDDSAKDILVSCY